MDYIEDSTENASSFVVNGNKVAVLSVPVSFNAGDIVMVFGQVEVTNPNSFNVGFGHYLLLTDSPTNVLGSFFSRATMSNVTPAEHHHVEKLSASKKMAYSFSGYLNLVIYAAASNNSGDMVIEQSYGCMSVVIDRA